MLVQGMPLEPTQAQISWLTQHCAQGFPPICGQLVAPAWSHHILGAFTKRMGLTLAVKLLSKVHNLTWLGLAARYFGHVHAT